MPSAIEEGPVAKRQKLNPQHVPQTLLAKAMPKRSRIFAPFRTVGLVSPTTVPFTAIPLGKTTFQLTTSVGRCLQTYDLRRGLNLVFITRPQTPGPITATAAWTDRVIAAWSHDQSARRSQGVWIFKRGKKFAELQNPLDMDEDIVQIAVMGSWIIGCCYTKIQVWNSATLEHYTTLLPPFTSGIGTSSVLTGGICNIPTYTNKILAGREDGTVELWNISTGKLLYTIQPSSADGGAVTALQPAPALSLVAIAYLSGQVVIHDVRVDKIILKINAGSAGDQSPITSISFRTDGVGAGDDGREDGVMATASFNSGDVTFWDLNNGGRRMGTLRGAHSGLSASEASTLGGISKIEFLQGQAIIVTSGLDNSLKSWIFDESPFSPLPRILHSRSGHAAPVTTLDFLPTDADGADAGGKWLLSSSKDRSLWGWSLRRDGQSTELSQGNIRKKAKSLGVISNGQDVSGKPTGTFEELKAPEITCLACSLNRDGGMGAMPGSRTIWANAKQLKGKSTSTEQNLTGWESVVTGHVGDKFARTWFWGRKRAGRWTLETGDKSEVKSVAISPCGTFALIGSDAGGIDMFNLQSGLHRQRFPARLTPAQAKRMQAERSPQARDNDLSNSQQLWAKGLGKHTKAVTGIQVDSLNRTVISCSLDGTVKFWDFMSGMLLHEIDWRAITSISRMVYHRPSDLMAVACGDLNIRVIDISSKRVVRELSGCEGSINDLCFSQDGRWIIASSSDSTIRTWDLPTSHLIDAIRLRSPCIALAFSNTGEYLAIAQQDSVGVDIWTNRTLFTHVPTRHISADEVTEIEGPTASGEGGQGILATAFDTDDDADALTGVADDTLPTLDQLSKDMTTLSMVPKSRWQTLLHLDLIRARNKPKEAPKAPEKAPFFLPAALEKAGPKATAISAIADTTTTPSALSRVSKSTNSTGESTFTLLLRASREQSSTVTIQGPYTPFLTHLKSLPPSTADIEIRSLRPIAPYEELTAFVDALTETLRSKRDYELVQAWMAVFLRCHGEVLQEVCAGGGGGGAGGREGEEEGDMGDGGKALVHAVRRWRETQREEAERLGRLVGFCTGVVGFLRGGR